jgi:hypothetical protein
MPTEEQIRKAIEAATADNNPGAVAELQAMLAKESSGAYLEQAGPTAYDNLAGGASALMQGGLMNFGDEVMGAGIAGYQKLKGDPRPFSKVYAEARDATRGLYTEFRDNNPKTALGLNIAGGVLGPGRFIAGGNGYGEIAKRGLETGALAGFGAGEGGLADQALSTGIGAAIGGVAAPALAWGGGQLVAGGRALGNRFGNFAEDLARVGGSSSAESSAMARATQIQGQTLAQDAADTYGRMVAGSGSGRVGPEYQRLVNRAQELGMELTPGERGNVLALRQAEAGIRSSPWIGGRLNQARDTNQVALNRLSAERIGADPVDELSGVVLGQRAQAIGEELDAVGNQIGRVKVDDPARRELNNLMAEATDTVTPNPEIEAAVRRLQEAQDFNVGVSGEKLMRVRSAFGRKARDAWSQGKAELAEAYEGLQDVLDGVVERQVNNPDLSSRWATARAQWRALKVLERPNVVTRGNVNPAPLNTSLGKVYKGQYTRAQDVLSGKPDPWFDAARISTWMGDVVGDSGTATRGAWASLGRNPNPIDLAMSLGTRAVSSPVMSAYMRAGPEVADAVMAEPSRMAARASGGLNPEAADAVGGVLGVNSSRRKRR